MGGLSSRSRTAIALREAKGKDGRPVVKLHDRKRARAYFSTIG